MKNKLTAYDQIFRYDPDKVSSPTQVLRSGVTSKGDTEVKYELRYNPNLSPGAKAKYAANLTNLEKAFLVPHNDAHFHPTDYRQKGIDLSVIVKRMDGIKCKHSVVMPIPTSLIALQGDQNYVLAPGHHHCGEPYYVPEKYKDAMELTPEIMAQAKTLVELGVDSEVDDQTAHQYKKLDKDDQAKLDPMITGLHLGSTYADCALFKKLDRNPGVFTGGGEITFGKEMVEELFAGKGQADLQKNIAPAAQLIAAFGVAGMPVTIHCDVDTPYKDKVIPGQPKNLEAFDKFLSDPKTQNTKIIWAHAGGLGRFVKEPLGHLQNLDDMMKRHPNLVLDISWSQVAKQLGGKDDGGKDKPQAEKAKVLQRWADFINKYSDRIMFGSDSLAPPQDSRWTETLRMYNEPGGLFSKLTPQAVENVTTKSYETHIKGAREDVRKFEKHVLPDIVSGLTNPDVTSINIAALREHRDKVYADIDITNTIKKLGEEFKKPDGTRDYSELFKGWDDIGNSGSSSSTTAGPVNDPRTLDKPHRYDTAATIDSTNVEGWKGHKHTKSDDSLDIQKTMEPYSLDDYGLQGPSTGPKVKFNIPTDNDKSDEKTKKPTTATDSTTDTALGSTTATTKKEKTKAEKALKTAGYYMTAGQFFKKYGRGDGPGAGGGTSGGTPGGIPTGS
jgi:hypothetical protein